METNQKIFAKNFISKVLKDKNGKTVFYGDVLRINVQDESGKNVILVGVVEAESGLCRVFQIEIEENFLISLSDVDQSKIESIGNIYKD